MSYSNFNRKFFIVSILTAGFALAVSISQANADGGFGVGAQHGKVSDPKLGTASQSPSWTVEGYMHSSRDKKNSSRYGQFNGRLDIVFDAEAESRTTSVTLSNMGGWQILGAKEKGKTGLHLGIEPLNVLGQIDTAVAEKAKQTIIRKYADENKLSLDDPRVQEYAQMYGVGDTKAKPGRDHFIEYIPGLSIGLEHYGETCRVIVLGRAGAALGASLDKYKTGVRFAAGVGSYVNCKSIDIAAELTRIFDKDGPIDIATVDALVKVKSKGDGVGIGLGVRAEAIVSNDATKGPVLFGSLPGSDARVESRAQATVRIVF